MPDNAIGGGRFIHPQNINISGGTEVKGGEHKPPKKPGIGDGNTPPPSNSNPEVGGPGKLPPSDGKIGELPPIKEPPPFDHDTIVTQPPPLQSPPPPSVKYTPPPPLTTPLPGSISRGAAIFLSCLPGLVVFVQLFNLARTQHEIKEENREIILNELKEAIAEMKAESAAIDRSFDAREEQTRKQANAEFLAAGQSATQAIVGGAALGVAYRQRNAAIKKGEQDLESTNAPEHTELQTARQNMNQKRAEFAKANPDDDTVKAAEANCKLKDDNLQAAKTSKDEKAKILAREEDMVKQLKDDLKNPAKNTSENNKLFKEQLANRDEAKKNYVSAEKAEQKAQAELNDAINQKNRAIDDTAKKKLIGEDKKQYEELESKVKSAKAKYDEKLLPYQRAADEEFSRVMRFGDMANQAVMSAFSIGKGLNEMSKIESMENEKLAEQDKLLHQTMRNCAERLIQSLSENTKEANDLFIQALDKLAQVMSQVSWKNG